jgi:Zn-dependent peptidase ImmA (M78 family)
VSPADEQRMIADTVRETYRDAGLPWPPAPSGPVLLDTLIGAYPLVHEEVPRLTMGKASDMLARWDVRWADVPSPDPSLAGFLYANARCGYIFVRRGDGLPRRRFTAAHELGHYRIHLTPELTSRDPADAEIVQKDETISETGDAGLADMERQANRFAAELLMPEGVCRDLHGLYSQKYGPAPRFLVYHIAGELLVSREAIGWRLFGLGLIDKPTWLKADREADDPGRESAEAE